MYEEDVLMADRIDREELTRRLAARMQTDTTTASAWIDGIVETLYESFKAGESVTLLSFGSFYVRAERSNWVFRFNPGQRLRALFGWSSSYKGER
jgi:DNA-binding protein HU-beta